MASGQRSGSAGRAAATAGFVRRVARAYGALEREQRAAAAGAVALFVTMFLPWYRVTGLLLNGRGQGVTVHDSRTAIGVFTFVEASVLLVAIAVLWLLFARAEAKAFHLPFGDGNVIFAAGVWVCLLVFWRFFDKPSLSVGKSAAGTIDLNWGIFVALLAGLYLAVSGQRLRAAHLVEPPLPGDVAPSDDPLPPGRRRPSAARERAWEAAGLDDADAEADAPTRVDSAGRTRPRPEPDARPTVVDRRGPSTDETLLDIPEYGTRRTERVPEEPPTEHDADPDGQLRLDGG